MESEKNTYLRNVLEKYGQSLILGVLLFLIGILIVLRIPYAYYFYVFVLGFTTSYLLFRNTEFANIIYLLLCAFLIGSGILILVSGIVALIHVQIRPWIMIVPLLPLLWIIYKYPLQINREYFRVTTASLVLVGMAVLSVTAHVVSVFNFDAPMLHDPMSHATWANEIVNTGLTNYFYSPGLHIIAALGEMSGGFRVAKQVLLLTNLFNALAFFPVFLFVQGYFKKNWFAIVASSLFIIAPFPSKFFWTAGKNGLVTAIPFLFLLLFFVSLKLKTAFKIGICNALVIILILTHYPTAFAGLILVAVISFFYDGWLKGLLNYLPATILGIIYGVEKLGYQLDKQQNLVKSIAQKVESERIISFSNLIDFTTSTFIRQVSSFVGGNNIFIIGTLGLIIIALVMLKDKKYLVFVAGLAANAISMYLIYFVHFFRSLTVVYNTQILLAFCAVYIGVGFLIGEIVIPYLIGFDKRFGWLAFIVLGISVVYFSYTTFVQYNAQETAHSVITNADIAVFDWMNANLKPGQGVINNTIQNKGLTFPQDGGGWLEAYTDDHVAMPFTEFWSTTADQNAQYYSMLKADPSSCPARNYFVQLGYQYYYRGSTPMYAPAIMVIPNELLAKHVYKLVFSSGNADLYQITACANN